MSLELSKQVGQQFLRTSRILAEGVRLPTAPIISGAKGLVATIPLPTNATEFSMRVAADHVKQVQQAISDKKRPRELFL